MNYCAGYIRQQENQQLGLSRETVEGFEPRLRQLVGYSVYNMLIGHINKHSPEELAARRTQPPSAATIGLGQHLSVGAAGLVTNLLVDDAEGVRLLTFNRPEKLNAFDTALYQACRRRARRSARTTTTSSASCSPVPAARSPPGRTSPRWPRSSRSRPAATELAHGFPRFLDTAAVFEKPLLAAVNGLGVGVGMTVAAALRPRVHRRHRAAPRAVRAARRRPRSRGQPADARDHGQPARRRSPSTRATGSPPTRPSRANLALAVVPAAEVRRRDVGARPPHRRAAARRARRDQAGRDRGPDRRHQRRPGARGRRLRRHGRRRRDNAAALGAFLDDGNTP